MVRNNNMIPNAHFHKKYQPRIKTWFDQPMQKVRRRNLRAKKQMRKAPKPVQLLRPAVFCPSFRYNNKLRKGRGFTMQELKKAGINIKYASTIGIAVDRRRKNRCLESLTRNAERLKEYKQKLIVFPLKDGKKVEKFDDGKDLNKMKRGDRKMKVAKISAEDRKFEAYVTLRKARCDAKHAALRLKRRMPKIEGMDGGKIN